MEGRNIFVLFLGVLQSLFVLTSGFNLTLLHTNDIHSRIEPINKYGGMCSKTKAVEGKCFGGLARLKTKIAERRKASKNSLLLDGGDWFLGTLYFYKFGGLGISAFMNHLGYDVMALGNHEFDKTVSRLIPFMDNVTFPILSSNIQVPDNHPMKGKYVSSHVFTINGERIGVVGYTTKDTPQMSQPGADVVFGDELEAVRKEVTSLTKQGINKILALGHAGFKIDTAIAASVEGVDIVIGGHDNTFLYTGRAPSNEDPQGEYPHVVTQPSGSKVLCVQDYAYGKYLGELQVVFDDQGEVTSWGGNPILLDNTVPQDESTLLFLEPYADEVKEATTTVLGRSHVLLDGRRTVCRVRECNMGNVLCDAMIMQNLRYSDSIYWNNVSIAITNAGGIRASITKGDITIADVMAVHPFSNSVDLVELYGRHVLEVLEYTAGRVQEADFGGFLQLSGIKVDFDLQQPVGKRVRRARALCTQCEVPHYEDVVPGDVYKVIMSSFLANGGDGYDVIKNNKIRHHLIGDLDLDIVVGYIKTYSPITQSVEDRITFSNNQGCPTNGVLHLSFNTFMVVTTVTMTLLTLRR